LFRFKVLSIERLDKNYHNNPNAYRHDQVACHCHSVSVSVTVSVNGKFCCSYVDLVLVVGPRMCIWTLLTNLNEYNHFSNLLVHFSTPFDSDPSEICENRVSVHT
jgi:hypothetical protein